MMLFAHSRDLRPHNSDPDITLSGNGSIPTLPVWPLAARRLSVVGLLALVLLPAVGFSDDVTLENGGVLRGKVAKSGKFLAVTTQRGTRVVVEQSSVKKIGHDAATAAASVKEPLTPEQKAWVPKVRKLLRRLESENRETSNHALHDLRAVNDPNALPALTQTLRTSDDEAARVLYVRILGDMPGSKAVVGLVEEALFDASSSVRDAAQIASKKQRPDYVRPYYGQALRFPNRDVVRRAASVLTTVGNKDNVPYLIDSLYSKTVDVVLRPSCCMSRITYLANPDGSPYGYADQRLSAAHPGAIDHMIAVPVVRITENPEVKEALETITKQSFGYNARAWRKWWDSTQLAENHTGR